MKHVQSNALISIFFPQPQDCISGCQIHWLTVSVGIHKNRIYSEKQEMSHLPWKKHSPVCDSYLQGNSAVTLQCLCVSPSKKTKQKTTKTFIWTVDSIWEVDTVLNKLLCTVEPKAIATLLSGSVLFKWTNSSQRQMLEECITSQEHRLLCRFIKRHFYWMHQKNVIIQAEITVSA